MYTEMVALPTPLRGVKRFSLLLINFLTAVYFLTGQNRIEWESTRGADHYLVEIRQNGQLVLETRSNQPGLPLFLPVGVYQLKVSVVNSFGKVVSTSESSTLTISAPEAPFIADFSPREIHENSKDEFRARVKGLVHTNNSTTNFFLEIPGKRGIELEYAIQDSIDSLSSNTLSEVVLKAKNEIPGAGSWNLVMTNPDGQTSRMDGALNVLEQLKPKISRISPNQIYTGKFHNLITLKGANIMDGAIIEIDGPSKIQVVELSKKDNRLLEYSLNLVDAAIGWYSITLTNPSGNSDMVERAFRVLPPPHIDVATKEFDPISKYPHSLYVGWNSTRPMGDYYIIDNDGTLGFSIGYSQEFLNSFFRATPILRNMSWDITFFYMHDSYTSKTAERADAEILTDWYNLMLGMHYVTAYDIFLNLILKMGAGFGYNASNYDDVRYQDVVTERKREDIGDIDFVSRVGVGLRVDITPRWYIDLTSDFLATFYLSRTSWAVQPRIEGGWRW